MGWNLLLAFEQPEKNSGNLNRAAMALRGAEETPYWGVVALWYHYGPPSGGLTGTGH